MRLQEDVGQAVAVAIGGDAARESEDIRLAIGGEHRLLGLGAPPVDAPSDAELRGPALQLRQQRPAADMGEAPGKAARQERERRQKITVALLRDRAPDRQEPQGIAGIAAVTQARAPGRRRKPGAVEAVIDQRHTVPLGREVAQMRHARLRAGDHPTALRELLALLPGGRGPDVLGMRRERPGQAPHQRRIARDRGRRVHEMRMQPRHLRRQLAREHERLAEAADAVGRRVAPEVPEERHACAAIPRQRPARAPAREHAQRLSPEIFRQVEHAGGDLRVDRMALGVGRMAQ